MCCEEVNISRMVFKQCHRCVDDEHFRAANAEVWVHKPHFTFFLRWRGKDGASGKAVSAHRGWQSPGEPSAAGQQISLSSVLLLPRARARALGLGLGLGLALGLGLGLGLALALALALALDLDLEKDVLLCSAAALLFARRAPRQSGYRGTIFRNIVHGIARDKPQSRKPRMSNQDKHIMYRKLDQTMWATVGKTSKGHVLNLYGDEFALSSLRGLEGLLAQNKTRVDAINIQGNALATLIDLNCQSLSGLKKINAAGNHIRCICANSQNSNLNRWPLKMTSLVELNVSGALLVSIPDLSTMPSLRELILNNNSITAASFQELGLGRNLELIDLRANRLFWPDSASFTMDARVFRDLARLKVVRLAQNSLEGEVADYAFIILAHIRSKSRLGAHAIQTIDHFVVNRSMKERADAIRKGKAFGSVAVVSHSAFQASDGSVGSAEAARDRRIDDMTGFAQMDGSDSGLDEDVKSSGGGGDASDHHSVDGGQRGPRSQSISSLERTAREVHIELAARHHEGPRSTVSSRKDPAPAIAGLVPKINELNALLEECFIQPDRCSRNLGELLSDVQRVTDRPHDHQFLFKFDTEEYNSLEIDEFLQNIVLLSERQPQVTRTLLSILVYLSTVAEYNFGQRCVEQLRDMMSGGEQQAKTVIVVVNECMIPWLERADDAYTRQSLMVNLINLAQASGIPLGLKMSPLDGAVAFIEAHLRRLSNTSGPSDTVIDMAAVASRTPRLAAELGAHGLAPSIAQELRDAQLGLPRFQALLVLVKNMALYDIDTGFEEENSKDAQRATPYAVEPIAHEADWRSERMHRSADAFGKERVHHAVLRSLRQLVEEKERSQGDQTNDTILRDCILCLVALANSPNVFVELIVSGPRFLDLLFELTKPNYGSGPVVLAAVYEALEQVLKLPRSWYQSSFSDVFASITSKLQGVTPLLQYLGEKGTKFNRMCKLVPREEELQFRGEIRSVATLHSPSMHKLLVRVINLITIYNVEAVRGRNPLALRVTQDLNKKNRETFLFACLETPSDEVRLAAVRCLQEIPLAEFEMNEINYLVEMLSSVINISSGKTEEVLGGSFRLLTKVCLSPHASGASFRLSFAEKSAAAALSILERNEKRDTRGNAEESRQKRVLSTACVQFLQAASQFQSLRNYLSSHEVLKRMVAVLYTEDENTDHVKLNPVEDTDMDRASYAPNMLERTRPGRQVEYLLQTLFGDRSVSPTRVVAPRILRRIADVLMGISDPSLRLLRRSWLFGVDEIDAEAASANDADETAASAEAEASLPGWMRRRMQEECDPHYDFRAVANRHAIGEKHMGPYWNHIMASQVGLSDHWLAAVTQTRENRVERVQQHQLLIHFQGLERLLLFLVSAVEKNIALSNGPIAGHEDSDTNEALRRSAVPSRVSVLQLFEQFRVPDVCGTVERFAYLAKAAGDTGNPALRGTLAGAELPASSWAPPSAAGSELLLQYFMEESRETTDVEHMESESQRQKLEPGETRSAAVAARIDQYPGADVTMFAPNAAKCHRRDTAITDTLVAALRVIYSLLKDGSQETITAAKRNLRMPKRLRILAFICAGGEDRPVWPQGLIGAKFMAIAYELCVMPGLRREESAEQLTVYAIICVVAKRILSTLRFFAESQTLGEADLVLALHTTRTIALIAAQLPLVRVPGLEKRDNHVDGAEESIHTRALDVMWKSLLPFESVVKGCLALVVACSSRSPRPVQLRTLEACVREHITQFLVSSFESTSEARYEILEELVRAQVDSRAAIRNSYIQDLLDRIPSQKPRKEHLASAVEEPNGTFRKVWAIEPPPPLERPSRSREMPGEVKDTQGAAGPASSTAESKTWEHDRIGVERILLSAFCDVLETPGPGLARRQLLVLTSEAYYLFTEPREGRGWEVGASAATRLSQDDLYSNPTTFANASVLRRNLLKPRLVWRKPYRAVQRIVLGVFGQRVHIKHKLSDLRDRTDPSSLTCLTYVSGVAARMYSLFLQMTHEWAQVETWLGAERSLINPPGIESDIPFREALRHAIHVLSEDEDENEDDTNGVAAATNDDDDDNDENDENANDVRSKNVFSQVPKRHMDGDRGFDSLNVGHKDEASMDLSSLVLAANLEDIIIKP
ncbi:Somatic embryosis receptor kinase 5 [Hondaea fermentalgiana]|uniref:Somatic embryosis receptor kinase 5 n=1 Tax=Hondaea fermentalgiana TaxID=2315210 RepID=A0A2R5G889_9STRA|nr:Somatic embryosis receptor kinase 5 [Hondaea fermentalgiana]|eukprot:GBG24703.1 Somatic embryosis receptor kinase 5 [Hondaea fermentalgiana]